MGDSMSLLEVFSKNLKKYRMQKGLSQEKFAELSGFHRTYISLIERGKRNITIDNIERVADALGIDAYLLLINKNN